MAFKQPSDELATGFGGGIASSMEQMAQNKMQLAMLSKRIEMEQAAKLQYEQQLMPMQEAQRGREAQAQHSLNAIDPSQASGLLGLVGATPQQQTQVSGLGPLQPGPLDTAIKGVAEVNSRKASMATHEEPIIDEMSGIHIGKETKNAMGITMHRMIDPNAKTKLDEYNKLQEWKQQYESLYSAYQKVRQSSLGTGFGRGTIQNALGRFGKNTPTDFLQKMGPAVLGQFTQNLEKVPGSRMSLRMAELAKGVSFDATLNPETADQLKSAFDDTYTRNMARLKGGTTNQRPQPGQAMSPMGPMSPMDNNDPLGLYR